MTPPFLANMAPPVYSIEDAHRLAAERGGVCLTEVYINVNTRMRWRCAENHEWEAPFTRVNRLGHWCKKCSGAAKRTPIWRLQEFAANKGGVLVSEVYEGNMKPLRWRCARNHEWSAAWSNIQAGKWCPPCSAAKYGRAYGLTIEDMRAIAAERGGACLSEEYVNATTPLLWICAEGHPWLARPTNVKNNGTWCPHCANVRPLGIEFARETARSLGGECLSDAYSNAHQPLQWRCQKGHTWGAPLKHIYNSGSWCPDCLHKSESRTREIFERLLGAPMPKCNPVFMTNPATGRRLELDGYSEPLCLGFEFQGEQHYRVLYYGTEELLEHRKALDRLKEELCWEHGVALVEVPCLEERRRRGKTEDLEAFIRGELELLGYRLVA